MGVHYGVRSSGNGFYSLPLPVITDGLQIYLDANVLNSYPGTGTTWFDLSGNNRNFTWSSVSYSVESQSYFNTSGRGCTGPASNSVGITNTSGYTIYLIMLQNSASGTGAFKFYKNNLSSTSGRAIFAHCTWSDGNVYFDQGGCCNSDTRTSASAGTVTTWNIFTFRRLTNSSTRTIFKNGTSIANNTATAANIDLDGRAITLANTDEYGTTWNARLAGFIVYNRGLSDAEITTNYNSLKTRYSWIT